MRTRLLKLAGTSGGGPYHDLGSWRSLPAIGLHVFDRLGMYVHVCIARAKSRFTNAFRVEINKVQGETNNAILYLGYKTP